MELPHARTGNKGIVTQTGAQYLNHDSSRIGLMLILGLVGLVPILG
jgi:hypothetical protein